MPVGADQYRGLLTRLLPPGAVWRAAAGGELGRWLAAFAEEFARGHAAAVLLADEADPRTADAMLAAWERNAGLPDGCNPATSTADRRLALHARLTARGGQSAAYFVEVAAALGVAITISEYSVCRAGFARAGDPCNDQRWAHAWIVTMTPGTLASARAGDRSGVRVRSVTRSSVECMIRRYRPAHTAVLFSYIP